jgi:hypothetical protein
MLMPECLVFSPNKCSTGGRRRFWSNEHRHPGGYTLTLKGGYFLTPNVVVAFSTGVHLLAHVKATGFPETVRFGLEPVTRPVWAPIGEPPIAHGNHRIEWLYVTTFAAPASGDTFWYVSNGVSKEFFGALLETFAREAEVGLAHIILLVLDNAGWPWAG